MRLFQLITLFCCWGCHTEYELCKTELGPSLGESQKALTVRTPRIWGKRKIVVCFDDTAYEKDTYAKWRSVVKDAVEESWVKALDEKHILPHNRLDFVGWKRCEVFSDEDVFIYAAKIEYSSDTLVHGEASLGEQWIVENHVTLNFDLFEEQDRKRKEPVLQVGHQRFPVGSVSETLYKEALREEGLNPEIVTRLWRNAKKTSREWKQSRFKLAANTAIHEFGHIMGFDHTQVRSDTPEWCKELLKDEGLTDSGHSDTPFFNYGVALGAWDEQSVMNYCHREEGGFLSELDIIGVRAIYNHPSVMAGKSISNDELCTQFGKEWEEYQN